MNKRVHKLREGESKVRLINENVWNVYCRDTGDIYCIADKDWFNVTCKNCLRLRGKNDR